MMDEKYARLLYNFYCLHLLFDHNLQNPNKQVDDTVVAWDRSEPELFADPDMTKESLLFNAEIHVREYIKSQSI